MVVVFEDLGEVFEAGVADESEVDVGQVADADQFDYAAVLRTAYLMPPSKIWRLWR